MQNRRQFLQSTVRNSALISLAPTLPSFLAKTAITAEAKPDDRILVVLFLDGGNDGINTVVPYADEGYAKHRDKLRLPTDRLIKINDSVGLHRSLRGFGELLESDRLAIIQGVGYPNPDLSHFRSGAIWQTASLVEPETQHGWLGRSLDSSAQPNNVADSVFIGNGDVPIALRGRRSVSLAMQTPEDLLLDPAAVRVGSLQEQDNPLTDFVRGTLQNAYLSADRMAELVQAKEAGPSYPRTALAGHLQTIARLIKSDFGTRVYYAAQSGYDTHQLQLPTHADLMNELGGALLAFLDDLAEAKLDDRVCVLAFSEFGRRVKENASYGTDHGTAGPAFVAGASVRSGLIGETPNLLDLENGNLKWSTDFRRVYTTLLEDWLHTPAQNTVGGKFAKLPLFG